VPCRLPENRMFSPRRVRRHLVVLALAILAACANVPSKTGAAAMRVPAVSEKAPRDLREVMSTLQGHGGDIYKVYAKALREDPTVKGKVIIEFTIAPSGRVIQARIMSTDIHLSSLEEQLLLTIRGIDFGARDVDALVTTYPIDFSPS